MTTLKGKRILAVDYGLKRIGTAVTDELHITVSPRRVVDNTPGALDELAAMAAEERVAAVVLGLPLRKDGSDSDMAANVRAFGQELERRCGLPIFYHDERNSTNEAFEMMRQAGVKKMKRREEGRKDTVAAAVILRSFLAEVDGGW